jgi:hypothetical protein
MYNHNLATIQALVLETYKSIGRLIAIPETAANTDAIIHKLEILSSQYEIGVIRLRKFCESYYHKYESENRKPLLPPRAIPGLIEINEYGWLHIALGTLLPHCRYSTPTYLTETITLLLNEFEHGHRIPHYDEAALVIDEHCDIESRTVYDQDNKGWKAIPNALKGRVIKDDDQFSLSVHLISTKSADATCHIYLLPQFELGDFFYAKSENYPVFP